MTKTHCTLRPPLARRTGPARRASLQGALRRGAAAAALALPLACQAIDFGPFSLTGFAKAEVTRVSDYCPDRKSVV